MRAVRFHGKEDIRIDTVPEPTCSAHQVLVAPAYSGICGSDLHEYLHGPLECPSTPHPLTGDSIPLTLGHEFSGVIVAVGDEVRGVGVGDRVAIEGTLACGECEPCREGNRHVCVIGGTVGQHGRGGGLAERVVCDEHWCHRVPDHVGLDVAALCEPLAVAEHAFRQVQPPPPPPPPGLDRSFLVLGCGAIGLGVVQVLRARGFENVFVCEISAARRRAALEFGAARAFDPRESDAIAQVKTLADGLGPHVVFECAGVEQSVQTAIDVVRVRGTIIEVALATAGVNVRLNPVVLKEISYRGTVSYTPADWQSVVRMLGDGMIQPRKMITKVVQMDKVVEDGIVRLARADEGLIKVLVEVNSSPALEALVRSAT